MRGNYVDALLSGLGALPLLGTIGKIGENVPEALRYLSDILGPGGKLIGEAGNRPDFRILTGDIKAAEDLTLDLGKLGQIRNRPSDPHDVAFNLPGGGFIGFRESQKYGPTIDINAQGFEDITKIHFE